MAVVVLDRARARQLAAATAALRCGIGAVALVAPGLALAPWIGPVADQPTPRLLARALGARDLALGLGTLEAWRRQTPVQGWVMAGALADAGDVAVTLGRFGSLPRLGRWMVLAAAAGAVVAAGLATPRVDGPAPDPAAGAAPVDGRPTVSEEEGT